MLFTAAILQSKHKKESITLQKVLSYTHHIRNIDQLKESTRTFFHFEIQILIFIDQDTTIISMQT